VKILQEDNMELTKLDEQIAKLKETISAQKQNEQAKKAALEEIVKGRGSLALAALEDAAAQKELARLRKEGSEISDELFDLGNGLQLAESKLIELNRQRADAFRAQKKAEFESLVQELLKHEATKVERSLTAIAADVEALKQQLHKLDRLATEAELPFNLKKVEDNLRWGLEHRLGNFRFLDHEMRENFNKPIGEILLKVLSGSKEAAEETQEAANDE